MKYTYWLCLAFLLGSISFAGAQKAYKKEIAAYRKSYKEKFLNNAQSALDKKGVRKLKFYKAKTKYQIVAKFEATPNAKPFEMPTSTGEVEIYQRFGKLHFEVDGAPQVLGVYRNPKLSRLPLYRNILFLPFKDGTNAQGSYGGGRYLDLKTSDLKEGKMTIDFNKAYNPLCAYKESYSCPVPPFENHLAIKIPAGEKDYKP